ncbi:major facilitator superfamily domain-containing protein, partial [Ochromonadaceae sp. CCMP2298]
MAQQEEGFTVYAQRWLILAIFCALEGSSNMIWVTLAPISDIAQNYFGGVDGGFYGSSTGVNMFANMYLITYLPGTIFSTLLVKNLRYKRAMEICGALTLTGAFLRYIAALKAPQWGHECTYLVMLLGQTLAGLAQPMFLNSPPAIASKWFPISERDMATTVGSMFAPIGAAVGQVIPAMLVSQHQSTTPTSTGGSTEYTVHGMADLMLVECLICVVPALACFAFFRNAPPTAPSHSTQLKLDQEGAVGGMKRSNRGDFCALMGNKNYLILLTAFSIGVGFFNALLTLLNQLVSPFGYSNGAAGTLGAVFIVCGLCGAGLVGTLMEKTRAYRPLLKCGVCVVFAATALFLCMLYSDNYWPLLVAIGILGFCMLPLLPVMMENCAECTYPIPEEMSMGLMFVGCNVLGLGFVFALQFLIEQPSFGPPPLLPANAFILGVIFIALLIVQFYSGEYKRLQNE